VFEAYHETAKKSDAGAGIIIHGSAVGCGGFCDAMMCCAVLCCIRVYALPFDVGKHMT
jgi:hypothetical protein